MEFFTLFIKKFLRYILKPLSFIPALVMMYFIISFSSQTGSESGSLSYEVSKLIILAYNKLLMKGYDNYTLNELIILIHPYVRKFAHVAEYFMLATCVSFPLYVYRLRGIALTLTAGLFCIIFACLDEYFQTHISGRVGSIRDVAIDSIGILSGIIVVRIVGFIGRKTIFSFLSLEKAR